MDDLQFYGKKIIKKLSEYNLSHKKQQTKDNKAKNKKSFTHKNALEIENEIIIIKSNLQAMQIILNDKKPSIIELKHILKFTEKPIKKIETRIKRLKK